jgi:hypothetical protein
MCITAWGCACRRCWCQTTCLESAILLERLSNCRMRYICLCNKCIVNLIWEIPEFRKWQRKRRQMLLKKRRKINVSTMSVWRCREDFDYSKNGVCIWVRLRVSFNFRVSVRVRVMGRVRVRVIRFIQLKSGSRCYGHAAATISHPYFGIVVWSKLTIGAIVVR